MTWTCPDPDCGADLIPDGHNLLWCPRCEEIVTDPKLQGDPDD